MFIKNDLSAPTRDSKFPFLCLLFCLEYSVAIEIKFCIIVVAALTGIMRTAFYWTAPFVTAY